MAACQGGGTVGLGVDLAGDEREGSGLMVAAGRISAKERNPSRGGWALETLELLRSCGWLDLVGGGPARGGEAGSGVRVKGISPEEERGELRSGMCGGGLRERF